MSNNKEDFNLKCDNLKQQLLTIINNCNLPIAMVYYIFKDLYHDIENTYIGYINDIRLQQQKEVTDQLENLT